MSKLFLTGLCAAAALGLAACGGGAENNMAAENFEDLNATEDMNVDMNMDMDMNAMDNAAESTETTGGNASGNEAVDNATGNSY